MLIFSTNRMRIVSVYLKIHDADWLLLSDWCIEGGVKKPKWSTDHLYRMTSHQNWVETRPKQTPLGHNEKHHNKNTALRDGRDLTNSSWRNTVLKYSTTRHFQNHGLWIRASGMFVIFPISSNLILLVVVCRDNTN